MIVAVQDHRHGLWLVMSDQPVRVGRQHCEARPVLALPHHAGKGEDRLRRHPKPVLPPRAARSRPIGKGGRGDQAAQFGMAQGADPERAGQVADVRDGFRALRWRRHAPQLRAQPAPRSAAPVADDYRRGACGRDIIARPRVVAGFGAERRGDRARGRIEAVEAGQQGVSRCRAPARVRP